MPVKERCSRTSYKTRAALFRIHIERLEMLVSVPTLFWIVQRGKFTVNICTYFLRKARASPKLMILNSSNHWQRWRQENLFNSWKCLHVDKPHDTYVLYGPHMWAAEIPMCDFCEKSVRIQLKLIWMITCSFIRKIGACVFLHILRGTEEELCSHI